MIQIYGAGMAGLLSAQMLRRHDPVVCEAAPSLPDNHGALLRFRSDAVARAVHQHFRQVSVTKGVVGVDGLQATASIADTNRYSFKVTGKVMPRSIMNLDPVTRYIAPDDFIGELSRYCNITYEYPATLQRIRKAKEDGTAVISTIPMPALMDMLEWKDKPEFTALPIWAINARIKAPATDVYQTLYYTALDDARYRASITGDRLIVECVKEVCTGHSSAEYWLRASAKDFGLPAIPLLTDITVKHQRHGKLLPVDERVRKEFILWATDEHNVYSIGRFATWRQLLLDDVVNDIGIVDRFITARDSYTRRLQSQ